MWDKGMEQPVNRHPLDMDGPPPREATLNDMVRHQGRLIEELQSQITELRNYVHDLAKRSDPAILDEVLGRQVGRR